MANEKDIVEPMIFLISNHSKYITGQNLIVDGGLQLNEKNKNPLFGSGNMAVEHFKAFSSFVNFKFVGVVARNKQKLKKFSEKHQIPYFSTDPIKAHLDTKLIL